jgi:hypothetical protein
MAPSTNVISVNNTNTLLAAIATAKAGQVIALEDGTYSVNQNIGLNVDGTQAARIFIRAKNRRKAVIEFCSTEGFKVNAPYWIIEGLTIRGICPDNNDGANEHAFHIVGKADATLLRDNEVINFKSHVKLNGARDNDSMPYRFPNDVGFVGNIFRYAKPLGGAVPHNALNIDGGKRHFARRNAFVDMATSIPEQRHASSIYFKMVATDFVVEQNLVVCEKHVKAFADRRGIYSGDAGMGSPFCSNPDCTNRNGLYRNNIIWGCKGQGNSNGILVNNEAVTLYEHNTVHDVKNNFAGNLIGTGVTMRANLLFKPFFGNPEKFGVTELNVTQDVAGSAALWQNPSAGDFTLKSEMPLGSRVMRSMRTPHDFCGYPREAMTTVGAIDYAGPNAAACAQDVKRWYDTL